jgi:hypothetical protein
MEPIGCGVLDTPLSRGMTTEAERDQRLILLFVLVLAAGDGVGTGQPAVEVDIAAALGAERL